MPDLTPSIFFLTLVLLVVLGAVFAAVGYAYHKGYFRKSIGQPAFCTYCGAKLGRMSRACGRCGAATWNIA